MRKILYIGLGTMGYRIAGRLSTAYSVKVWDILESTVQAHAQEYRTQAVRGRSPFDEDHSDVDFFMTCLPTSKQVTTYVEQLTQATAKPGSIWIDNTSGVPHTSEELEQKLKPQQVQFVDAAISGGRRGAADGTLCVMVGGPKPAVDKSMNILNIVGNKVIHVDERVGAGHAIKGINNLIYGCNLAFAMKAAQAVEKLGIDIDVGLQAITTSSGGSTAMQRTRTYMMNNRYLDYRFKAHGLIKDMDTGMQLMDKQDDNDPVFQVFSTIREAYVQMAKITDWEEADMYDIFHYLEKA